MKLRPILFVLTICAIAVVIAAVNRQGPTTTSAASVTKVSAGYFHTCALTGGAVKCWGRNNNGQLGDGTTTNRSTPVSVCAAPGIWNGSTCAGGSALTGVSAISAGGEHTCALMTDTKIKCWGYDIFGQLGDNSTGDVNNRRLNPRDVCDNEGCTPIVGFTAVAAGGQHTCAVVLGTSLTCWGDNSQGQLGEGTTTERHNPATVCKNSTWPDCAGGEDVLSGVSSVAAGAVHTCARMTSGGVKCWGENIAGGLGDGTTTDRSNPVDVCKYGPNCSSGSNSITTADTASFSVGQYSSIALNGDNPVVSHYDGANGNLKLLVCTVPDCAGDTGITADTGGPGDYVGLYSSLRLDDSDFPVVSYQDATNGDLKVLRCNNAACGTSIITPLDTAAWTGYYTALALDTSGATDIPVIFYGANLISYGEARILRCANATCSGNTITTIESSLTSGSVGQRGLTLDSSNFPVAAYDANGTIKVLHCGSVDCASGTTSLTAPAGTGSATSIALDSSGYPVVSYRSAADGYLHVLHCNDANCAGSDESDVAVVSSGSAGYATSIELDASGNPVISFEDATNQDLKVLHCGNDKCTSGNSIATPDSNGITGSYSGLVLDSSGNPVVSYFNPSNGALKLLTCGNSYCTEVLTGASSVAAGGYHSCAVISGGGVKCWGENDNGQLGNGNWPSDIYVAVDVCADAVCDSSLSGIVVVTAGWRYTCAGPPFTVKCWGDNAFGQLTDGNAPNDSDTPRNSCADATCSAPVSNLLGGAASGFHGCAVTVQGNVLCSGYNAYGQLGDGTTTDRDVPVSVVGLSSKATPAPTPTPTPTPVALTLVAPNLNKPWGVFLTNSDGSGSGAEGGSVASTSDATSIYYAESGDHQVHVKVLKSGSDTVIAGSGSPGGYDCNNCTAATAKLNGPRDVFYAAVDSALYIADTQNCLVRKVSGGTITNVAGVAPDPLAHCGYDGEGPATSHQLNKPSGVSVDPDGNIYIADTLNCLVRKVSAGTMSTVAGVAPSPAANCGSATAYPSGPAPDDQGPATSAVLRYPYDVSLLYPDTDLLIAEGADTSADGLSSGHNRIRRVEVPGGVITTAAGGGTCVYPYTACASSPLNLNLNNPEGVAAADYKIYIAQAGDSAHPIVTVHAVTNAVAPAPVDISGITVNQVKSVAVNSAQTNGIRTLAISIFGTTSSNGGIGSGNDLGGNPSASYRPTAGCTALPGIQSIDWALPTALLGLILTRKRIRTLFIVLRSAIRPRALASGAT